MPKLGRPRALTLNRFAVEDALKRACMSRSELCTAAGISPAHLSEALHTRKGCSPQLVRAMATALDCQAETIAPELTHFVAVRLTDETSVPEPAEVAS